MLASSQQDTVKDKCYRIPRIRISMVREGSEKAAVNSIQSPSDVVAVVEGILKGADREYFLVLTTDTKNKVNGVNVVSAGTLNSSLIHPREVFKLAVLQNAASVVLVHNHPSGDPTPSKEDLAVTRKLREAGQVLQIEVMDHIIIGAPDNYFSMRERSGVFQESGEMLPLKDINTSEGWNELARRANSKHLLILQREYTSSLTTS